MHESGLISPQSIRLELQKNREKNFRQWYVSFLSSKSVDHTLIKKILDDNIFWNRNVSEIANRCEQIIEKDNDVRVFSDLDGVFEAPFYRADWQKQRSTAYLELIKVLSKQDLTVFSSRFIINPEIYKFLAIAIKFLTGIGYLKSIPLFLPQNFIDRSERLEDDYPFGTYPSNVLVETITRQDLGLYQEKSVDNPNPPQFIYLCKRDKDQRKQCANNILTSLKDRKSVIFIGSSIIDREFFKKLVRFIFNSTSTNNSVSFQDCMSRFYYLDTNLTIY